MRNDRLRIGTEKTLLITITIAVVLLLQYGSWQLRQHFSTAVYAEVEESLRKNLDAIELALNRWFRDQSTGVRYWARQPEVIEALHELSPLQADTAALATAPAQQRLRLRFVDLIQQMGYRGYFILDLALHNIASSRDTNLGVTNLLAAQPEFFSRLRENEVALSLPLYSDVPLNETGGESSAKETTMFVGATIRNAAGALRGYFLFRLSVPQDFIRLFAALHFGSSGEVLAFDRQGHLLNHSRFEQQLRQAGRLADGQSSQLQPFLATGDALITPAASALRDKQEMHFFNDFRGIDSLGVARWLPDYDIGVLAKVDHQEATRTLMTGMRLMDIMTWSGSLLLLILAGGFYLLRLFNWRTQSNLAAIFNNSGEGIITINKLALIENINPAASKMFGYEPTELIGKNVNILMPEDERAAHDGYVHKSELYESRVINRPRDLFGLHKDGHLIPLALNVSRMRQAGQELFIGILHNISDRVAFETELKRFKTTLDQTLDSVFMFEPHSLKFFYANLGAQELVGYNEGELLGMTALDITPHTNEEAFRKMLAPMLNNEVRSINFETLHQHKEGHTIPVEIALQYVAPEHEKPRMVAIVRNIRQRKETERVLRQMEDLLQRSQQIARVGSWEWDIVANQLVWTDETYRMFGIDKATAQPSYELFMQQVHPDDRQRLEQALQAAVSGEVEAYDMQHRILHPDGDIRHVHEVGVVYRDEQGEAQRMTGVVQDITERVEANTKLQQEKAATDAANRILRLTQDTLEHTGIAEFWIAAEDGRVLRISEQGCRHLNYRREELLQMKIFDFDQELDTDTWRQRIAPIRKHGWARFESHHRRSSGEVVPVEITTMYQPASADYEAMFVTFCIDISERKQAEQELIRSREAAEAAVQAKSAFLATMSHEIRTPMNGVIGMIELLRNSHLNNDQRRMVGVVEDSSRALLRIIDDILDLSKIEAGKLAVEHTPLSISAVLGSVADIMRPIAQAKPLRFYLDEDPRLPSQVIGDPVRLRQILYNLCGNAIKFCEPYSGTVELSATLLEKAYSEGQQTWVRFTISDNGIGMSEEVQANLFTPFYQAEASTTRRFGGTGLGLSICKSLAEMMGGTIAVESLLHQGTSFTVELPFQHGAVPESDDEPALADLSLLFFVPDAREWRNLELHLRHAGYHYQMVSSEQALHEAISARQAFDVIILMQPFSAASQEPLLESLRRQLADSRFVLAVPDTELLNNLSGNDTILLENYPLKPGALHHAIASAVGRASPELKQEQAKLPLPAHRVDREQARQQQRLILVAEDNPTNQEVILRQLELLGYAADIAADGSEALQMWRIEPYALLLTDCHMPQMDGYQLTTAIREEEAVEGRPHTHIVAITANALQGEGEKCLASGMDGYLSKPLELERLKVELARWLPSPVTETDAQGAVSPPPAPAAEAVGEFNVNLINPEVLSRYIGHDQGIQQRFLRTCLESARKTVSEIHAAIEHGDLQQVAELGHRFKSAAHAAGAEPMAELFRSLEKAGIAGEHHTVLTLQPRLEPMVEQFAREVAERT